MTARQFATIVTRALAVFTVIQAVAYFPMVFSMVSAFDKLFEGSIVLGLVPPLLDAILRTCDLAMGEGCVVR